MFLIRKTDSILIQQVVKPGASFSHWGLGEYVSKPGASFSHWGLGELVHTEYDGFIAILCFSHRERRKEGKKERRRQEPRRRNLAVVSENLKGVASR